LDTSLLPAVEDEIDTELLEIGVSFAVLPHLLKFERKLQFSSRGVQEWKNSREPELKRFKTSKIS
jgi:hypothetical protein